MLTFVNEHFISLAAIKKEAWHWKLSLFSVYKKLVLSRIKFYFASVGW